MRSEDWNLLLILGFMSISLRLIGLYCGKYISQNSAVQAMLHVLPGSLLIAIVGPDLLSRGFGGVLAMAATLILVKITNNTAVSMLGGIAVTAACRAAGIPS